jgi:type I site-specific restriction endonuclease
MPANPEQAARENIDRLLTQAGWAVQDIKSTNLHAGAGVAIHEFPLATGHGCADYLLYVQGKAAVLKAAVEGRLVPTEAELARKEGRTYETGEQLLARILSFWTIVDVFTDAQPGKYRKTARARLSLGHFVQIDPQFS